MVQRLPWAALVDGAAAVGRLALHDVPSAGASGAAAGGDRRPVTARPVPARHWRSYGTDPLPAAAEALDLPLAAFPSWFLRISCDRCGKDRMLNEAHASEHQRNTPIRVLLHRMRHEGCGGRPGRVELLTGIDGVSSRPVRRIVLRGG
jgi:hypothetical protein